MKKLLLALTFVFGFAAASSAQVLMQRADTGATSWTAPGLSTVKAIGSCTRVVLHPKCTASCPSTSQVFVEGCGDSTCTSPERVVEVDNMDTTQIGFNVYTGGWFRVNVNTLSAGTLQFTLEGWNGGNRVF